MIWLGIQRARRIMRLAPELEPLVRNGALNVSVAQELATLRSRAASHSQEDRPALITMKGWAALDVAAAVRATEPHVEVRAPNRSGLIPSSGPGG